jgi:hypothetical protein
LKVVEICYGGHHTMAGRYDHWSAFPSVFRRSTCWID